jgi:multidrug resistance protein
MLAPDVPLVAKDIGHNDQALSTFSVSIYVLAFIVGPLIFAPMSEMYGRLPVIQVSISFFLATTTGCALATDMNMLIGFRFLAGCFGSAPMAIGPAAVTDMFPPEFPGRAMAVYTMGNLLGVDLGPVVGGFVTEARGWRWIFWVIVIMVTDPNLSLTKSTSSLEPPPSPYLHSCEKRMRPLFFEGKRSSFSAAVENIKWPNSNHRQSR